MQASLIGCLHRPDVTGWAAMGRRARDFCVWGKVSGASESGQEPRPQKDAIAHGHAQWQDIEATDASCHRWLCKEDTGHPHLPPAVPCWPLRKNARMRACCHASRQPTLPRSQRWMRASSDACRHLTLPDGQRSMLRNTPSRMLLQTCHARMFLRLHYAFSGHRKI